MDYETGARAGDASSGARGFVLALVGLLGIVAGGAALAGGYAYYMAQPGTPAAATAKAAPARSATPAQAPAPVVLSAGRALPMPDSEPETKPKLRRPDEGSRRASATRAPDGHFYFETFVNGTRIVSMFDTGAGRVALTYEDAVRMGVDVRQLNYDIVTSTANGTGRASSIVLASVRVGDITKNNVQASILPKGSLGVTLLGQAFSLRLKSYRYERSELILIDD